MQLELPLHDPARLQSELEQRSGMRVSLTLTDNAVTVMSVRRRGAQEARLRLHRMFLSAEPNVLQAVAHWMQHPKSKRTDKVLDHFIRKNRHLMRAGAARRRRLCTQGRRHDLRALFEDLNAAEFDGAVTAAITWGRMPSTGRRHSMRFGSYSAEDHLIRIHPLLDQEFVPVYFVRYIVFHEMLHAHLGIEEAPSGRRRVHTREFAVRERAYPDYARAVAWQSDPDHMKRLLR